MSKDVRLDYMWDRSAMPHRSAVQPSSIDCVQLVVYGALYQKESDEHVINTRSMGGRSGDDMDATWQVLWSTGQRWHKMNIQTG